MLIKLIVKFSMILNLQLCLNIVYLVIYYLDKNIIISSNNSLKIV